LKEITDAYENIDGNVSCDTINTTGNVDIAGDLVVGTTNVITEIGTKQDTIEDGDLTIAKTAGLQTALDNKYDDTGGTILGDVQVSGNLTIGGVNVITGGTILGDDQVSGNLIIGGVNVITEIGTKQDTIEDGDLTIAKTAGLQTALVNKYDKTGCAISGGVQISGQLAPNGNIFTDERLVIQSGNTMEILDDTEVKISSGIVDIVVDGVDESISLNGYTYLNGTLELLEDEGIILNNVGGGGIEVINYFNYNKLKEDVAGKQDTITPSTDLSCNSFNTNQLIVDTITTTGNVDISGLLMVEDINVKGFLSSIQTQVDSLIDLFGGGVNFRAYTLSSATFNAGNVLVYDNENYYTENSYDTSTGIYTIVIAGTYVFTLGWYVVSDTTAVVNLIRERNSVETILKQSTNGTNTDSDSGFFITTIAEYETGDEIYAYLDSGACRLIPNDITDPTTLTSFSGSRLSS